MLNIDRKVRFNKNRKLDATFLSNLQSLLSNGNFNNLRMKKILLFTVFSILSLVSTAQVEVSMEDMRSDWKLIKQDNGVELYISVMECQMGNVKQPFLYGSVKVINNSTESKVVDFTYELQYTDGCSGCSADSEYTKYITVAPGSEMIGACDFKQPELTILLVNPLQTEFTELSKLVINNLKIQ